MSRFPQDRLPDSSIALIADPYRFISKRCERYESDMFQTRLLLQKNICMRGREAAKLFYDQSRFVRAGAVLKRFEQTLFGEGGVQGMQDAAHHHRKRMFMALMTLEQIDQLADIAEGEWVKYADRWMTQDQVVLYPEVRELLCRSVCQWAGVELQESEVDPLTLDLAAMYESAGSMGVKHLLGRQARKRRDLWAKRLIEDIRTGKRQPPEASAAHQFAWHRDHEGQLLDAQIAGVELQNVLRPTVAVSVFITFAALALHEYPECREKLAAGDSQYAVMFAQEVRRFYPFFPAVAARVRQDFEWRGCRFPQGMRVILDIYGTNHDAQSWEAPHEFRPERFRDWDEDLFSFIPQGGGDQYENHRCPGDQISVELLNVATRFLCQRIRYDVPPQDLRLEFARLPALPRSRFVISHVRGVT